MNATDTSLALRTCPLCGFPVQDLQMFAHVQYDLDLLTELKRRNPSWVQADGSCPKGIEQLRASRVAAHPFPQS